MPLYRRSYISRLIFIASMLVVGVIADSGIAVKELTAQTQKTRSPRTSAPAKNRPSRDVQQVGGKQSTEAQQRSPEIAYEPGDLHLQNSHVYIHVGKVGLGHEHAVVGNLKSGRIQLDVEQDSGELVFDMTSFIADTNAARQYIGLSGSTDESTQQQVNENMLGKHVLDVQRYPTATFTITSITKLTETSQRKLPQYQLDGEFTLHGTARKIKVIADAEEKENWIHLRGGFAILQTRYGITPFSKAFGAIGVADQLTIWGDFWIARKQLVAQKKELKSQQ